MAHQGHPRARLIPGATNNIGAILIDNDELATTPTAIAEALKHHWEPIFRNKPVQSQILHDWLNSTTNFHHNPIASQSQRPTRPPTRPVPTSASTSRSTSPASSDSSSSSRPHTSTQNNDVRANASQSNTLQNHPNRVTDAPRTYHTRPTFSTSEKTGGSDATTSPNQSRYLAIQHHAQTAYLITPGSVRVILRYRCYRMQLLHYNPTKLSPTCIACTATTYVQTATTSTTASLYA